MRLMCKTHRIVLEKEGPRRRYSGEGLSWAGTPMCQLFVMKDPRPGKYGECEVVQA